MLGWLAFIQKWSWHFLIWSLSLVFNADYNSWVVSMTAEHYLLVYIWCNCSLLVGNFVVVLFLSPIDAAFTCNSRSFEMSCSYCSAMTRCCSMFSEATTLITVTCNLATICYCWARRDTVDDGACAYMLRVRVQFTSYASLASGRVSGQGMSLLLQSKFSVRQDRLCSSTVWSWRKKTCFVHIMAWLVFNGL